LTNIKERRTFCKTASTLVSLCGAGAVRQVEGGVWDFFTSLSEQHTMGHKHIPEGLEKWTREARFYTANENVGGRVICGLCPNTCHLGTGQRGRCRVRINNNGKLHTLVYGNPSAVHIDPIEKKPLFHFLPESRVLSFGFAGCNFRCLNCQNWQLSQKKPEELNHYTVWPQDSAVTARREKCSSIAFTYNEPSVTYEWMFEAAQAAHEQNIKTVYVSNGYINQKPLREFIPFLDSANIDLKSFSDDTYKKLNGGRLQPVLDTLVTLKKNGVWVEITTLLVPGWSDSPGMIRSLCQWVMGELGPDVPIHFSRFHPDYKLQHLPSTAPSVLLKAREIAREEGLYFPYIGNFITEDGSGSTTYCPFCHKPVVVRFGFTVQKYSLEQGACSYCKKEVPGKWA